MNEMLNAIHAVNCAKIQSNYGYYPHENMAHCINYDIWKALS